MSLSVEKNDISYWEYFVDKPLEKIRAFSLSSWQELSWEKVQNVAFKAFDEKELPKHREGSLWRKTFCLLAHSYKRLLWGPIKKDLSKEGEAYPYHFINDHLILSRLPCKDELDELIALAESRGKKLAFLQIMEDFELEDRLWMHPVNSNFLEGKVANGAPIRCHQIEAADLHPLPISVLEEAVPQLKKNAEEGYLTICHCKSGIGRSNGVVVAYLSQEGDGAPKKGDLQGLIHRVDEVLDQVKAIRPQVKLHGDRKARVIKFLNN
jgi:hypothetical protein